MFERFWGNPHVGAALEQMIARDRLAQTLLFAGPEGVGKATMARRLAARLLGHAEQIERDDLSLPENLEIVASRERWPADKRNQDPLLFASYADFVTFPPDGPLRQISIDQTRLLREWAKLAPNHGSRRVFLIDHVDRAGEHAANALLKTLEEPSPYLVLIMTAENAYDLLPTIRSRAVPFQFVPVSAGETLDFVRSRGMDHAERRAALSGGSPGVAVSLDLEAYEKRREAMFTLLRVAAGVTPFDAWVPYSEAIGRTRSDKLELHLKVLYDLLRDVLVLRESGGELRNPDLRADLEPVARRVSFAWIREAVKRVDDVAQLIRRNIQKSIALDALIVDLRKASTGSRP
ncbi:MAG: AAA family ATPase [Bryobacteraceae bacterium]|jgi:DNA polymerase-3 subunit delta'